MGKGDTYVRRQSAAFRNALERAVAEQGGSVGVAQASRIVTAATAMRRAMQVERRLAADGATLSIADWTALADRSIRYRETIDRCLQALGLDTVAKKKTVAEMLVDIHTAPPQLPEAGGASVAAASGILDVPEVDAAEVDAADATPEALAGKAPTHPDEFAPLPGEELADK